MSTLFFERQEAQKSYSRWLVWAFIGAILLVVAVINLVVLVGLGGNPVETVQREPLFVLWTTLIVLGTIFGACWHKSSEMRAGGTAVARSLGGVPVTADDLELAPRLSDPQAERLWRSIEAERRTGSSVVLEAAEQAVAYLSGVRPKRRAAGSATARPPARRRRR